MINAGQEGSSQTPPLEKTVAHPLIKATTLYFNFHPGPDSKFKGKNIRFIYT